MNVSPLPRETTIVQQVRDPATGKTSFTGWITSAWDNWLSEVSGRLTTTPTLAVSLSLTAQHASIAPTSFALPSLSPGLYRVNYYARVTTAGSVSSSLTVTIGHTDGAVSCTQSGAAMTTNTTATNQGGSFVMRIDQATAITYSTTYADGGGGTSMQYRLDLTVESLL